MTVQLLEDSPAPCALGRVSALESPSTDPQAHITCCRPVYAAHVQCMLCMHAADTAYAGARAGRNLQLLAGFRVSGSPRRQALLDARAAFRAPIWLSATAETATGMQVARFPFSHVRSASPVPGATWHSAI